MSTPAASSADSSSSTAATAAFSSSSVQRRSDQSANSDVRPEDDEKHNASAAVSTSRVHLHRHALESVFACLDIAALATVLAVNRDWQAAVNSMRSFGHHMYATSQELVPVMTSRMRHHVTDIFLAEEPSLAFFARLHERMPHLLRLSCECLTIASEVLSVSFPPRLQEFALQNARATFAESNVLLRSIGDLSQLRELSLGLEYNEALSFAPLASLSHLRSLDLGWIGSSDPLLSDAQVDEFRALVHLESVGLPMDDALLKRLLRPPHDLRWQSLSAAYPTDDAACALLPSLRCLAILSIPRMPIIRFDWLPRMQSLTEIDVGLSSEHLVPDVATRSLLNALQRCPALTVLTLWAKHMRLTTERLSACLADMPALITLNLCCASLTSLSFLALPSLAQSLQNLSLQSFRGPLPTPLELNHLHGLRSLQQLTLWHSFDILQSDAALTPFRSPSALLPKLTTFQYLPAGNNE